MIFAAGLGTRLKPFTLNAPKAMAPVNGKPLIQKCIEYLGSQGFDSFVVNVHHFADQIVNFIKDNNGFGYEVQISDETDNVLETGGGLLKARPLLENAEHFLVMNVDILTDLDLSEMCTLHTEQNALATLGLSDRQSSRGLLFNKDNTLCGWLNKKTDELKLVHECGPLCDFAFSGIQVLSNKIFDLIPFEGKFSIIDVYLHLAQTEKIVGYDHSGATLLDVGKPESLKKAEELFA